jgi:hypothetical protein
MDWHFAFELAPRAVMFESHLVWLGKLTHSVDIRLKINISEFVKWKLINKIGNWKGVCLMTEKRTWETPRIVELDAREALSGTAPNADVFGGQNNTAFGASW